MMRAILLSLASIALMAQSIDLSPRRANVQTTLPATCVVGDAFFKSNATAGQNLFSCTTTNNWTVQGGSGTAPGYATTRTSTTVLTIAAGISRIGTVVYAHAAATGTLSGASAASTAYIYIDSAGTLTMGHNGATTLTCGGCTTVTGVTGFPASSIPLATATYATSLWDVSGITDRRATVSRSPITCGSGLSCTENAPGDTTITNTGNTAISPTLYLPFGLSGTNTAADTSAFTANQTRWVRYTQAYRATLTGMGLGARVAIGAGAGLRFAVADTSGTILHKTAVNTTCAGQATCRAAFTSPITLDAGNYYIGITTSSISFRMNIATEIADEESPMCLAVENASPAIAGTGTIGSGTGASVDFGASMGSITSWSCDAASNTFVTGFHDVYFYN